MIKEREQSYTNGSENLNSYRLGYHKERDTKLKRQNDHTQISFTESKECHKRGTGARNPTDEWYKKTTRRMTYKNKTKKIPLDIELLHKIQKRRRQKDYTKAQ